MIMLYEKIRSVNFYDFDSELRLCRSPKTPVQFKVPIAYALAISQLGRFKVSGLMIEYYYTPMITEEDAANFCLEEGEQWSPTAYVQAVEIAEKAGMKFHTVDLSVKKGSAWWLLKPQETNTTTFRLLCPFPEENFTIEDALVHALFCVNSNFGFMNPIFDLTPLGPNEYGSMLRNPMDRIDVATFNAVVATIQ